MAVPTFVNAGVLSSSASAATLTPALPGALILNRVIISCITVNATGKTFAITGPAGWTIGDQLSTGNQSGAWAWRIVDHGEAAPIWTWTGAAACQAQVFQFAGNDPTTPTGTFNSAFANSSTTETIAAITSTADNSLILLVTNASTAQTIPIIDSSSWTNLGNNSTSNGSNRYAYGADNTSGGVTPSVSVTISSANWVSFGIEILGTGASAGSRARTTQVVQQAIETYTNPTTTRTSQVVQQAIETYTNPTHTIVSQVVIQVLRTVSGYRQVGRGYIID